MSTASVAVMRDAVPKRQEGLDAISRRMSREEGIQRMDGGEGSRMPRISSGAMPFQAPSVPQVAPLENEEEAQESRIQQLRKDGGNQIRTAARLTAIPAPKREIHWTSYAAPILLAVFKDILDLSIFLALPGISTVIASGVINLTILLLRAIRTRNRIRMSPGVIARDVALSSTVFIIEGVLFPINILPIMIMFPILTFKWDKRLAEK